ncbi:hypothetical protein [Veronia pacifica]|uniref:Uncharacterized protein n=1 Tax=Veronia pacifica TaxID=1080227 RepID=A0A1C3EIQ1_9GAMM|nr:hypothetical protein [Veronia pacifica]ODA33098.1 hypothetical protein A8L45_11715 [Veronia pacifica]
MPSVIDFPSRYRQTESEDDEITEMIREELNHLSSNQFMIETILSRMKPFIETLDYDLELDIEADDEEMDSITAAIPHIQSLQSRFDEVITAVISERILHEIHRFHIERANKVT